VCGRCACPRPKAAARSSAWRAITPILLAALMPKCPMCLFALPGATAVPPRPAPLSEAAKRARAPRPPEELVGARHERLHIEKDTLIASVPLKASRPK
jgi:hypothetical protein